MDLSQVKIIFFPGTTVQDLIDLLSRLAGNLMFVAGALAVIFIIIGGLYYITSSGNPERTEKGKKVIISTIIGIVVISLSLLIVSILADFFSR